MGGTKTSTPQYSWDSTTCQAVRFLAELESQLKLKLGSGKVGRPRKENKLDPTPITGPLEAHVRTLIPKISRVVEIGTLPADHAKTLASRCFQHHPAANIGNAAGRKPYRPLFKTVIFGGGDIYRIAGIGGLYFLPTAITYHSDTVLSPR